MTNAGVEGGCLCGAVRYRIGLPPIWVAHCHCSLCRRAQGAGFVTWVGVAEEQFSLQRGAEHLVRYASSASGLRSFCGRCGSPLFFRSQHWLREVHVTLATLDSTQGLAPSTHAYWSSRAPWADWRGEALPTVEPPDHGSDPAPGDQP